MFEFDDFKWWVGLILIIMGVAFMIASLIGVIFLDADANSVFSWFLLALILALVLMLVIALISLIVWLCVNVFSEHPLIVGIVAGVVLVIIVLLLDNFGVIAKIRNIIQTQLPALELPLFKISK